MLVQLTNNSKRYAIDLKWSKMTSIKRSVDQQKIANLDYGFFIKKQSIIASTNENDKGAISAAGLLSLKYENLVLITDKFNLSDDHGNKAIWICIINKSKVLESYSFLSDEENKELIDNDIKISGDMLLANEKLLKVVLISLKKHFQDNFKILADCESVVDLPPVETINFEKTLESLSNQEKLVTIKKFKRQNNLIFVFFTLIVVIFGIWFGYKYLYPKSTQSNQDQLLISKARAKLKTQQEKAYFDKLLTNNLENRSSFVLNRVIDNIKNIPLLMNGWQLSSIDYSASNSNQIVLGVDMQIYSNLNALRNYKKNKNITSIERNGQAQKAKLTIQMPNIVNKQKRLNIELLKKKIGDPDHTINDFITTLQNTHINYQIKDLKKLNYGISSQKFILKGESFYDFKKLAVTAQPFIAFTLNAISIKINNEGNFIWTVSGDYYA